MHTIYHFNSADDITVETINTIKMAYITNLNVVTMEDELL